MNDKSPSKAKWPLPMWCFVVLGVPTFFMPLAYAMLAVPILVGMAANQVNVAPTLPIFGLIPVYVTVALWPI